MNKIFLTSLVILATISSAGFTEESSQEIMSTDEFLYSIFDSAQAAKFKEMEAEYERAEAAKVDGGLADAVIMVRYALDEAAKPAVTRQALIDEMDNQALAARFKNPTAMDKHEMFTRIRLYERLVNGLPEGEIDAEKFNRNVEQIGVFADQLVFGSMSCDQLKSVIEINANYSGMLEGEGFKGDALQEIINGRRMNIEAAQHTIRLMGDHECDYGVGATKDFPVETARID